MRTVTILLALLSSLAFGQARSHVLICPGAVDAITSSTISPSVVNIGTDLHFITGNTGSYGSDPSYNCIEWGPVTAGNHWYLCGKPNAGLFIGNNGTHYTDWSLSTGSATFAFPVLSTVATGGIAYQSLTGAKTCIGTGGTICFSNVSSSMNVQAPIVSSSTITAGSTQGFSVNSQLSIFDGTAASTTNGMLYLRGQVADGAAAVGVNIANLNALTTVGAKVLRVYSDNLSTEVSNIDKNGNYQNLGLIGTNASGTGITANYSGVQRAWLHKVTVINTALAAAGTSDVTLHVTPANTRISRVIADVTQVFTGGTLSAMTVMCGNAAGGNQYLLANSVFTAQNTWGDVVAEMGAGLVSATLADFGTVTAGVPGAITVQCRFTCTGANCSAATQGSVTFYVEGVTYP